MKHEPRCIYPVTCTCVSILREQLRVAENYLAIATQKLNVTYEALKYSEIKLAKVQADKASNDADYLKCAADRNSLEDKFRLLELRLYTVQELYDRDRKIFAVENESLRKKIEDGLSCCCSGCTKHNQDLT